MMAFSNVNSTERRHLLDFPKRREEKKHEQDLGLATKEEDECELLSLVCPLQSS